MFCSSNRTKSSVLLRNLVHPLILGSVVDEYDDDESECALAGESGDADADTDTPAASLNGLLYRTGIVRWKNCQLTSKTR